VRDGEEEMSLYPELENLAFEDLVRRFHGRDPDNAGSTTVFYDEVASRIRDFGEQGILFLLAQIGTADSTREQAILLALGSVKSPLFDHKSLFIPYLSDTRPLIVAQAIEGLKKHGEKEAMEYVIPLLHHTSPFVIGACLRFVGRFDPTNAIPILIESLKSPYPIVRSIAVDELDNLGVVAAIPQLLCLLNDPDSNVREATQSALGSLEKELNT
jgi:hypothetical protein